MAAIASIGAVVFTAQQVSVAKDTEKRQLRAYLSKVELEDVPIKANHKLGIKMGIVNHGLTPAHDVEFRGLVQFLPFPLPGNHIFDNEDVLIPEKLSSFPNE